ncbi:MAG: DUF2218 domain-containing protein [Halomonas sp.]|uniref:DUF2218 domain-containing protein n=1 Tax=Halomonas sp. TaxID=1486246 RepID=UPI001A0578EB|nr:DUF2218 domain-containing protein [Halomonas sp.]MBE0489659.1 DUF2218 domain-containing protein [Halomonas sp.]
MPISRAEIRAEDAEVLIDQLCQRWSADHEVERGDDQVEVRFEDGSCFLVAEPDKLMVVVEAVEDHLHDRLEGEVDAALDALKGVELDIVWEA